MKRASIDIGTNTVLMTVAGDGDRHLDEVLDVAAITRLGEGLRTRGVLSRAAMDRTLMALREYGGIMANEGVEEVRCVGTAAFRDAENGGTFAAEIERAYGFPVRIITADEEAYYTYLSVARDPLCPGGAFFIIDIGGGSTEVMRGDGQCLQGSLSLPFGSVKLAEMFISHDPPEPREIETLKTFLSASVEVPRGGDGLPVFGTAGTVTNLGALTLGLQSFSRERLHGLVVTLRQVDRWVERLAPLTVAERRSIPGMEAGRADVILPGMMLLGEILERLGVARITVSTKGVRFGLLYER